MSNGRNMDDDALPMWMHDALRRPVATRGGGVERIMTRVRRAAGVAGVGGPAHADARRRRHASRLIVLGATLAACVVCGGTVIGLGSARALWRASFPAPLEASAALIGDSIVSTLHDTLALVRFALRVRDASSVALAGTFNAWSPSATPLARQGDSDQWTAVVPLRRGDSRYAFLVDDTRWVAAPRITGVAAGAPAPTRAQSSAARSSRDSS